MQVITQIHHRLVIAFPQVLKIHAGKKVDIFIVGTCDNLSKDCQSNYKILCNMNVKVNFITTIDHIDSLKKSMHERNIVIDAVFGTGLSRDIKGIHKDVITAINGSNSFIISIINAFFRSSVDSVGGCVGIGVSLGAGLGSYLGAGLGSALGTGLGSALGTGLGAVYISSGFGH